MHRKRLGIAGSIVTVMFLAIALHAVEADFDPSVYNPDVAEIVNFEVCQSCLGAGGYQYAWDFDADGVPEIESDETVVTYAFGAPGYYEVVFKATADGGRSSTMRKGIVVGQLPAFAVRELMVQSDDTVMVLVNIYVTSDCRALGFQEEMPRGWQLEVVDAGGAFAYPNPVTKKLEVVWGSEFAAGEIVTFSYRLYPAYSAALQGLTGELSGYTEAGRFLSQIGGELGLPQ